MSNSRGQWVPRYLTKHYPVCVHETNIILGVVYILDVWDQTLSWVFPVRLSFKLIGWIKQIAFPSGVGLIQFVEGLNMTACIGVLVCSCTWTGAHTTSPLAPRLLELFLGHAAHFVSSEHQQPLMSIQKKKRKKSSAAILLTLFLYVCGIPQTPQLHYKCLRQGATSPSLFV